MVGVDKGRREALLVTPAILIKQAGTLTLLLVVGSTLRVIRKRTWSAIYIPQLANMVQGATTSKGSHRCGLCRKTDLKPVLTTCTSFLSERTPTVTGLCRLVEIVEGALLLTALVIQARV